MFDPIVQHRCEAVHSFVHIPDNNPDAPWRAVIAVHSTRRGPALGGCRFVPYQSGDDALQDALRLAQGMSRKAALAGLDLGGGKAVIMMPEGVFDRQALFRWFGHCVERLSGEYITAMDAGTQVEDMDEIFRHTRHVASHSQIGDPSPHTARGVWQAIRYVLHEVLGLAPTKSRVAVQGLGHVGMLLTQHLLDNGVQVIVSDVNSDRCQQAQSMGASVVAPEQILQQKVDLLAPCALGGVIHAGNLDELNCQAIVGAANNQLEDADCGRELHQRGVIIAPDYLVNAGGLVFASGRYQGWSDERIAAQIDSITEHLGDLLRQSQQRDIAVNVLADQLADEAIAAGHYQPATNDMGKEALWSL
jgi:leucine dehydrogenase